MISKNTKNKKEDIQDVVSHRNIVSRNNNYPAASYEVRNVIGSRRPT